MDLGDTGMMLIKAEQDIKRLKQRLEKIKDICSLVPAIEDSEELADMILKATKGEDIND